MAPMCVADGGWVEGATLFQRRATHMESWNVGDLFGTFLQGVDVTCSHEPNGSRAITIFGHCGASTATGCESVYTLLRAQWERI